MKKQIITFALAAGSAFGAAAQSQAFLDINNARALVYDNGLLFNDTVINAPGFEIPAGSGSSSIYASNFWIGAVNVNQQLHLSAGTYNNGHMFHYGPVMDDPNLMPPQWERVWKINRTAVDSFIGWWDAGIYDMQQGTTTQQQNYPNYTIPQVIIEWPAHGDVNLGQNFFLAPFYDRDGDGIYNPAGGGDYPMIRGDQTVLSIFNDQLNPFANPLRIEVISMIYGYDCASTPALNNTVFSHYEIRNMSTQTFFDSYVGQWTDLDLGNAIDDFIGTDVERGAYYIYNGDDFDEAGMGQPGYGDGPPAQGVVFLAGPLQDADGTDNAIGIASNESINGLGYGDGAIDNERLGLCGSNFGGTFAGSGQGSPNTAIDYYNYLRSLWQDGTHMVYGGNGHIADPMADPNQEADFMFPGDSDPLGFGTGGNPQAPWSDFLSGNIPGDRRGLGSFGPFTIDPGEYMDMDLAFVWGIDSSSTLAADGLAAMLQNVDDIRSYFGSSGGPCGFIGMSSADLENPLDLVNVYPNPANDMITVDGENLENYTLYNMLGALVAEGDFTRNNRIPVSAYERGVYLLRVSSETHSKTFRLILK